MKDILEKLNSIEKDVLQKLESTSKKADLENLRIKYLGRKSELNTTLRTVKDLPKEQKAEVGKNLNTIKTKLQEAFEKKAEKISDEKLNQNLTSGWIDVTKPTPKTKMGHSHIITQTIDQIEDIAINMGFTIQYPYEIDTEYNNFTAVNIQENHPARDVWDTFHTDDGHVTIVHTSSIQNRVLRSSKPPIACVVPGKCFRNETTDARHEHTFYQFEGVFVDRGVTMGDMMGTLKLFLEKFFEKEIKIMLTSKFYPFVEPGGTISVESKSLGEEFKKVTKGTDWLEILGCGMIHPKVLEMGGIDPNVYSGFAWGVGIERLIMLKYNIDDIRLFHKGDLRFIKQF